MRLVLRIVNVVVALATLASALAVLASDLAVPDYREHYRDALWFVTLYAGVQALILIEFLRDGRLVPWLAVAKALAAYAFLANFLALWPQWRMWTPARYVYQLFDTSGSRLGLFALVFLGRGAFNTVNAMYFTMRWWQPLRVRAPLLGRIVTALPVGAVALFVWAFLQLVKEEARTFSPDASEVAQLVLDGVDCEAVRGKSGQTTTDTRQRGKQRYEVLIRYGCALTQVVVRAEDGRIGTASGPRAECCGEGSGRL